MNITKTSLKREKEKSKSEDRIRCSADRIIEEFPNDFLESFLSPCSGRNYPLAPLGVLDSCFPLPSPGSNNRCGAEKFRDRS